YIRLRGQEFLCSDNEVSVLARKLTGVYGTITTKLDFSPEVYQHSAGLILYYDNMNFLYLRKYFSETLGCPAISVFQIENGVVDEHTDTRITAPDGELYFRMILNGREIHCEWSTDGEKFRSIGGEFDLTKYSDEYSKYGRYTGTFVGIACQDALYRTKTADFDFFDYDIDEEKRPLVL
ncbi:MAG: glycoside hydrolase family 43 protein, partial [Oscillospiraceae bacterium]